jgi:hypothetical protein
MNSISLCYDGLNSRTCNKSFKCPTWMPDRQKTEAYLSKAVET